MAARSGVVDTSVFKGVADLHAGVMSDDPVVAPAHEVVQDSDMVSDPSIPLAHADAVPEHSGDPAIPSTEDASAGDTGHVHADLAYAAADHAYADADHAYADHAYADHGIADLDHAYADHAYADHLVADVDHVYADATAPDSAVAFADHPMMPADDGTPHSLGADAGKAQGDDGHDAAAWGWAGGAAVGGVGLGILLSHDNHDDTTTTVTTGDDVHVVVERGGAFIDTNGDGIHDAGETTAALFGAGHNADLAADHVHIHFNDVPLDALDLTGFGADDKITFDVPSLMDNHVLTGSMSYLSNVYISTPDVHYRFTGSGTKPEISVHQHIATATDFAGNQHEGVYALSVTSIYSSVGPNEATHAAIAYWTDAGNALNHNSLLLPYGSDSTAVRDSLNAGSEGGLVDFIWPTTPV